MCRLQKTLKELERKENSFRINLKENKLKKDTIAGFSYTIFDLNNKDSFSGSVKIKKSKMMMISKKLDLILMFFISKRSP